MAETGTTAVVLFNLGGPDRPEAVQPFLFNLFNDPAIIGLPQPLRWLLAKLISGRRAPLAREIYGKLGGGSPLLANTEAQAQALEAALNREAPGGRRYRVIIAMRYWHPRSDAAAQRVAAAGADRVVLLPLYPQFSTTTSASSVRDWRRAAGAIGLTLPSTMICCYPLESGLIEETAALVEQALTSAAKGGGRPRVLFSAHGLPKKVVTGGDPYQWQVEQTAAAVVAKLGERGVAAELDWLVCYQSRVGPLEWIGPATDDEIARAGRDGVPLVVVPIAFVSEHSETLVELDIEYRELAEKSGVPAYVRVSTVGAGAAFVAGLAKLVRRAEAAGPGLCAAQEGRLCPAAWRCCPNPAPPAAVAAG
ncbi:MAG: ferrochelatase [Kiloniellales bacterium]